VVYLKPNSAAIGRIPVEREPKYFEPLFIAGIMPIAQQGTVVSKEMVDLMGGFDDRYLNCADLDFVVRLFKAGASFRYYPNEVAAYRIHLTQLSRALSSMAEQVADIRKRHYPAQVSWWWRSFAVWRFRAMNSPRIAERILQSRTVFSRNLFR
jgi:GT2 family glycosyltransferase